MARLGKIPNSQLEINIEGNDEYVSHMHICSKSGKNVVLRIKLASNEYFREKDDRMNTLNSSERKALNKYLAAKVPYRTGTRWDQVIDIWNTFNPAHMVDPNKITQPGYTTINELKK